jgi:endo-1,4-beta-xylanase
MINPDDDRPMRAGHGRTRPCASAMTRRFALRGVAGGAMTTVMGALACAPAGADFVLELEPPLRRRAKPSGIQYGCAGSPPTIQKDAIALETMASEAGIFVSEGCLKWDQTEPFPGTFNFDDGDSMLDFAERHGMTMHGHTLVWYAANPPWVSQLANAREARAALERHIGTSVAHYRGKFWAWDVVNEPIEPQDNLDHGYRKSIWLRRLGIDYIDLAFRLARTADSKTPLSLNEYGFEYSSAKSRRKRDAILALLRKLRDSGAPIDCFGMQAHLEAHETFDRAGLTEFLREVVGLGYRLMITELDVNDVQIAGSAPERDAAVARHAADFLDIVFAVERPRSISTWGLSDRYTWMRQYFKRADGRPLRPLPLDADFQRKPLWSTLAKYLSA